MLHKHERPVCCLPDCARQRWSAGRCGIHSAELKRNSPAEFERLQSLTKEEQEHEFYLVKHGLPLPTWEYENPLGEAELIRTYGRDSKRSVKIGAFRTAPQQEGEHDHE